MKRNEVRMRYLGLAVCAALATAVFTDAYAGPDASKPEEMKAYKEEISARNVSFEMVPIAVGATIDGKTFPTTFKLGSPASEEGRSDNEGPQIEVEMEPFWMGKTEVTWDNYNKFRNEYYRYMNQKLDIWDAAEDEWADAVSIPTPLWEQDTRPILTGMGDEGGYPVADISPYAAKQFSKWVSKLTGRFYRLPTEAEWEYAARAGTTTAYFFGDDPEQLDEYAWTFDNSAYDDPDRGHPTYGSGYRKVGEKKPNPWGLYDIYGNVAEWCLDGYEAKHYEKFADKKVSWREVFSAPKDLFPRVCRGGHWDAEPQECRSAFRFYSDPMWQDRDPQIPKSIWWYTDAFMVGFRVVRPLNEPDMKEKLKFWDADTDGHTEVLQDSSKEVRAKISAE